MVVVSVSPLSILLQCIFEANNQITEDIISVREICSVGIFKEEVDFVDTQRIAVLFFVETPKFAYAKPVFSCFFSLFLLEICL